MYWIFFWVAFLPAVQVRCSDEFSSMLTKLSAVTNLNTEQQVSPVKTNKSRHEVELEKFANVFSKICIENGPGSLTTTLFIEAAALASNIDLMLAKETYCPELLNKNLREYFKILIEQERSPNDPNWERKLGDVAYIVMFLLYELVPSDYSNIKPGHIVKLIELVYRYAPGCHRFDVAIRRLLSVIHNSDHFNRAAELLVEFFPLDDVESFPFQQLVFHESNIRGLKNFLNFFYKRITDNGAYHLTDYLVYIISINTPNTVANEIIKDLVSSGKGDCLFKSKCIIYNWINYLDHCKDNEVIRILLSPEAFHHVGIIQDDVEYEIAHGGLLVSAKKLIPSEYAEIVQSLPYQDYDKYAIKSNFNFLRTIGEIFIADTSFNTLKLRGTSKSSDVKQIDDVFTDLVASFASICTNISHVYVLAPDYFSLIAKIANQAMVVFLKCQMLFNRKKHHFDALILALNAISILNSAPLYDHSDAVIDFWHLSATLCNELVHHMWMHVNSSISSNNTDNTDKINVLKGNYRPWIDFVNRVFLVKGVNQIDFGPGRRYDKFLSVIERLSSTPELDKADLAISLLKFYDVPYFMEHYSGFLESAFNLDMAVVYSKYLAESLVEFTSPNNTECLHNFQKGTLLNFCVYISSEPTEYVPLPLFATAKLLLDC